MARLMLSLDGQILAEYNMNKERYTIGRLPDNDIRIDNPAVSGHHPLRFVDSQDGDAEQDEFEKTMVITPSSQGEERIRRVGVAVDQAAKAVAAKRPTPSGVPENATALPKAKLQVLSGAFAGRELEL